MVAGGWGVEPTGGLIAGKKKAAVAPNYQQYGVEEGQTVTDSSR